MKILAIEFSSAQRSVAIVERENLKNSDANRGQEPGRDAFHRVPNFSPEVTDGVESVPTRFLGSHGGAAPRDVLAEAAALGDRHTHAFELIEQVLRQAKLEREEIECLAVGLGPGSYTGIRVAIAIAQGWQLARGVPLLGLGSVETLALQAQQEGLRGPCHVVIDAQRNEFYVTTWELTDTGPTPMEPLRLASLATVEARVQAGGLVIGPDVGRWLRGARVMFPAAGVLAHRAAARADFVSGEKLEPIYLRETHFVKAPPPRVLG